MQLNLWTILLIALACMFFGYFFGLFEGRGQGYRKRKKEEGHEKTGVEPIAPPAGAPAVVKDDPGLLRLKEENGQFRVDIDGVRVQVDSLSPEQRKRLIELITRFRPWVEGRQLSVAAPAPTSTPLTAPPPAPVPPAGTMSMGQAAALATPARTVPAIKKDEPVAAPTTMVGQIDAILQERMLNTPLAERGIWLEEAADGSVSVRVGLSRYQTVGEVPDPEVQTAIRAAIAEWERKFTPGL